MTTEVNIHQIIKNTISDTMSGFFYYDRKEDDLLPVGAIEEAVAAGKITFEEIADHFIEHLWQVLREKRSAT